MLKLAANLPSIIRTSPSSTAERPRPTAFRVGYLGPYAEYRKVAETLKTNASSSAFIALAM